MAVPRRHGAGAAVVRSPIAAHAPQQVAAGRQARAHTTRQAERCKLRPLNNGRQSSTEPVPSYIIRRLKY